MVVRRYNRSRVRQDCNLEHLPGMYYRRIESTNSYFTHRGYLMFGIQADDEKVLAVRGVQKAPN
jgi:hypothetical protein